MLALFIIASLATIGALTLFVLADSGLRWWSAFGALRRALNAPFAPADIPSNIGRRPGTSHGSVSAYYRVAIRSAPRPGYSIRVAA
ncbi:MAG: hypothetical protein ACR2FJ_04125 [Qipengyuania sp.]